MIEVRNLVKRYGDHLAVNDISFTIEKGKIYGFLGPNGAGKSTTMNIMTGYLSPTSGEVYMNGHSIMDEPELAKKSVGYLPEQPPLYTDMTVREYLRFSSELKKVPKNMRDADIEDVINRARISEVADRLIGNLSKGYRQRVGVAQAILGSPEIVILDEPTVGLDPNQIIDTRDLIRSLGKDHTVILSSHILSEIQAVCDHILIIHKGDLIANGTTAELEEQLGGTNMELTFKTDDQDVVRAFLRKIPGILKVKFEKDAPEGEVMVTLKLERGLDLREQVYRACVEDGLVLLSMRSVNLSLENIFIELTSANNKKHAAKSKKEKSAASSTKAEPAAPAEEAAEAESVTESAAAEPTDEKEENE